MSGAAGLFPLIKGEEMKVVKAAKDFTDCNLLVWNCIFNKDIGSEYLLNELHRGW